MSMFTALRAKYEARKLKVAQERAVSLEQKAAYSKQLEKEYIKQEKAEAQLERVRKLERVQTERKLAPIKNAVSKMRGIAEKNTATERRDVFGTDKGRSLFSNDEPGRNLFANDKPSPSIFDKAAPAMPQKKQKVIVIKI